MKCVTKGAISGGLTSSIIQLILGVGAYINGIKRLELPYVVSGCPFSNNTMDSYHQNFTLQINRSEDGAYENIATTIFLFALDLL